MSTNQNGIGDAIRSFGGFLQKSKAVSLLMVLMVFATGVLLLWEMPNESDLPQLKVGDQVQEDIVARITFKCKDMKVVERKRGELERNYPAYLRIDPDRTTEILEDYGAMTEEIRRCEEAKTKGEEYKPLDTTDEKIAVFVKDLQPTPEKESFLYSILLELVGDEQRCGAAAGYVTDIVKQGIIREPKRVESDPVNPDPGRTLVIQDLDQREIEKTLGELLTPESAAERTVNSLLAMFPYERRIQLDSGKLMDFFVDLYRDGNLSFDRELTDTRKEEKIAKEIAAIPEDDVHEKDKILIHQGKLSKPDFELLKEYRRQYELHRLGQRTWSSLVQNAFLVLLLVIFSCIFILRFHPDLVGNNRSVWLIGFIVIFSLLFNCGIMKLFNQWILDGRLATKIPLYLAMPFALPALVIASIYDGRSAVFAGLFVAGVSAVALDLSFPAFTVGLLVCAFGTAFIRHVYDYKKFFMRGFVACVLAIFISSLIFQQNPDIADMIRERKMEQIVLCFLSVPVANGLVTAGTALVLIILLETVLDVTCSMSYLSMTDRNHPLLKKLQMEAPGTYHHSERVALLAEEAANSVGAMSQKVQAYALFHDVGKLASPEMFTENADGKDMSEGRTPEECAAIIRNHVEYGVQLAKKYKLKTPLRRAIERHHGNDFISFLYEKEKERTGEVPPEEPFRYPGPLPDELEVVILMLADCCEAAVCSLPEPTEENVRALVEKIFNGKLQRKQLDSAPVTIAQLSTIRESFLKTFESMNHARISYPRHEEKKK